MTTHASGAVLAKIATGRLLGKSLPQIAEELNRDPRYKPARGARWSVSTVRAYQVEAGRRLRLPMRLTARRSAA